MQRNCFLIAVLASSLFLPAHAFSLADVREFAFEGLRLHMTLDDALSVLTTKGLLETAEDIDLAENTFHVVKRSAGNVKLPSTSVIGRSGDGVRFELLFVSDSFLSGHWLKGDRKGGESVSKALERYIGLYGEPDTGARRMDRMNILFLVWGQKTEAPYFQPRLPIPALRVEINYERDREKKTETVLTEETWLTDICMTMGFGVAESNKHWEAIIDLCRKQENAFE